MTERRTIEHRCTVCDKPFTATRHDATTCGPTCRQRARRAAHTEQHSISDTEAAVQRLIDRMKESGDNADLGALRRLRRLIDEAITAAGMTMTD